jgi:sporulation related protein
MADHRQSFRPRRLAFGGRLFPCGRLLGAALALLCALGPAEAQDAGLKNGAASLSAGKYDAAVRQLSATVNNEKASPGEAAKSLYLRGVAYRKLNQPGRAISDFGAALWLGLPTSDKVRALVNKGLAYRSAGLSSQAEAELARARSASSASEVQKIIAEDGDAAVASANPESFTTEVSSGDSASQSSGSSIWSRLVPSFGSSSSPPPAAPPAPAPAPPTQTASQAPTQTATQTAAKPPSSGWGASVTDETAEPESGNRASRWFGSLTGQSAPAPTPAPAPSSAPQTTTAARTPPPPKTAAAPPSAESWAANTETQKVVSEGSDSRGFGRWFGGSSDSAPAAPAAAPAPGGGYRVQLANSRSQAEAQDLWKQVSKSNGQLASAQHRIDKVDIGSFGTFYSLNIGPFANQAEGTKVCNALKRSGTDCSVVSPDGP